MLNKKISLFVLSVLVGAGMMLAKKRGYEKEDQIVAVKNQEHAFKVEYTNYRNEVAIRTIVPQEIYFGKTEYHTDEQWLLKVWDVDRNAERVYSLKEVSRWFVE